MWNRRSLPALLKRLLANSLSGANAQPVLYKRVPKPLALEQRFMFDAAAVDTTVTVFDSHLSDSTTATDTTSLDATRTTLEPVTTDTKTVVDTSVASVPVSTAREVMFIEDDVPDFTQLVSNARAGVQVYVLDHTRDGLLQISDILQGQQDISAIHIVTHGSEAAISLGTLTLDAANITQFSATLQSIGKSLSADGDILVYGCDIAAGNDGQMLINSMASLTSADVNASTDTTGAASTGGNWQLEFRTGQIDTSVFLTDTGIQTYADRLTTVSLSGSAGWVPIMFGASKDPNNDSQAGAADTDIIGDATHGSLYTAYSDSGTTSTADDYLYFRMRIDNPTSPTNFSGVAIVGIDANGDGRVDLFMSVDGRNNSQAVKLLDPGTGLNISPNTTTTQPLPSGWLPNNGVYAFNSSNYSVNAVSALNDPNWGPSSVNPTTGTASNLTGDAATDVFISWRIPLADLAAVLAQPSLVDKSGVYGPRGSTGIQGFNKDTVVKYVSFTQTQPGPINGDLNGVGASYDKNATFAQLGAFTDPMSASNPVPASTGLTITDNVPGIANGDVTFTFKFTDGVTGFDINDITISGGTKGTFTQVSADTYTLVVHPAAGTDNGTIDVSVSAGAATSNGGLPTSSASANQAYDTLAPTVSIDTPATALSGTPTLTGHSNLSDGSMISVALDTDNNGTADLVYQVMVNGGVWSLNTATALPASGTMSSSGLTSYTKVTATATDAAGNSATAVELNPPTVNTQSTNLTAPVITGTWTSIAGDVLTVTVNNATYTLSPAGNTWSLDLSTATPTSGTKTALVAGQTYDVTATVTRSGDNVSDTTHSELVITSTPVKAIDIAGGATASGSNTYPTITGTSANAGGFVIIQIDPNNDGNLSDAVTYSVVTDGSGNWSLNTSSAQPISGSVPSGGYVGSVGLRATDSTGAVTDTQVLTIATPTVTIGSITSTATADANGQINNTGSGLTYLNMTEDNAVTISGTATNGFTVNLVISDANGHSLSYSGITVSSGTWSKTGLDLSSLDSTTLTVKATLSGTAISATDTSVTHDTLAPRIFNTTQSTIAKTASSCVIKGVSELPAGTVLNISLYTNSGYSTLDQATFTATVQADGSWSASPASNISNISTVYIKIAPSVTTVDAAGNIVQSVLDSRTVSQSTGNSNATINVKAVTGDNLITLSDIYNGTSSTNLTITGESSVTSATVTVAISDGTTSYTKTATSGATYSAGTNNWSLSLTPAEVQALKNGQLTVTAQVTDTTKSVVVYDTEIATVNLQSPTLAITDSVPGTASGAVTFTFTFSEDVGTSFTLADITVTDSNGGTPTLGTLTQVNATTYTLLVTPPASTSGTLTVAVADGTAKGANSGRNIIGATDAQAYNTTGAAAAPSVTIDTDALATDNTPLITGTSSLAAGAPIVVTIDLGNGSTLTYSAIVQTGGTWSLDVGSATPVSGTLPSDGIPVYAKVTATATNAYGNSTSVVGLNIPTVTQQLTNSPTPTVTGYWTNVSGDSLSVVMDGITYTTSDPTHTLHVSGNTWSFTAPTTSDGSHQVVATTTRGGSSKVDVTTFELVVDTHASVVISGGDNVLTKIATPVISGTVADVPAGSIVTVGLDTDNNGSVDVTYTTTSDGSGNWSINTATLAPTSGLLPGTGLNGTVVVHASVADSAGNHGTDIQTLVVDVTPPEIAFSTSAKTADTTPLITGTTDLPAGSTITLVIDGTNTYTAVVQADGSWSVDTGNPTANGGTGPVVTYVSGTTLQLKATGTDAAGNATEANKPLVVDTTAPVISIQSPLDWNNGDSNNILSATEDDAVIIKGDIAGVADGQTIVVIISDGTTSIQDTATVSNHTWALGSSNLSALKNGTIYVTATYTDSGGNDYTARATVQHDKSATVAIDSISQDTGVLADFTTKDSTVAIYGTATPGATVGVVVKNASNSVVANFSVTANASTGAWSTTDTSALVAGSYTIEATVGGTTVSHALTIVDATAPTLVSSTPADNASGISISNDLTLTFSKDIGAGSGFIGLYKADGTLIESFNVATGVGDAGGSLTFNGTTGVTLNPFANLQDATDYYLKIDTSAIMDSVGNTYAGISDATTLNFRTGGVDTTPPAITGPSGSAGDATASKSVAENTTAVTQVTASESVTWSLQGGTDASLFDIDASGNLSFKTAPDYETPGDSNTNNTYVVVV
uniref:DUF4347 domain-containing protein n=1 Tax=Leeia oryzae TaxID=356662 RepID=UPI00037A7D5A